MPLLGVQEKNRQTQRQSLIDTWYRVHVSTQPLVDTLNETFKQFEDNSESDDDNSSTAHGNTYTGSYHDDDAALTFEFMASTEILLWVPEMQCPNAITPFRRINTSKPRHTTDSSKLARSSLLTLLDSDTVMPKTKASGRRSKKSATKRPAPFPCPSPFDSGTENTAGPSTFSGSYTPTPTTLELTAKQQQPKRRRLTDSTGKAPVVIDLTQDSDD